MERSLKASWSNVERKDKRKGGLWLQGHKG